MRLFWPAHWAVSHPVGRKEAADNEEMGISGMGHTSARNCRQAQGANGLLLVGAGSWGDPQCHACPSQDAESPRWVRRPPHLLPAGSMCIQVEMPLQVCVDSAPSGPAPCLCLARCLNSVLGEREKGSRKRHQGKWGWLRRKEQQ